MEASPLSRGTAPGPAPSPTEAAPPAAANLALDPPHHPRHRILEEVGSRPGMSITDLAGATGLGHTTVCHHLGVLLRRGLIARERWGGSVRIFPATFSRTQRALVALARAGRTGDVLRALAAQPRASPAALARELGLHRQAVQWHLARLEKAGVLRVDREHRPYRLALTIRPESVARLLPAASPRAPAEARPLAALPPA